MEQYDLENKNKELKPGKNERRRVKCALNPAKPCYSCSNSRQLVAFEAVLLLKTAQTNTIVTHPTPTSQPNGRDTALT